VTKAPAGKARRPAGSIPLAKCGDDRDGGTSGNAKDLRRGVRQSSRSIGAMAARSSMQTHTRTPPGTASLERRARGRRRGREAREPMPSVGPGAAKATPGVISAPRQDRGKGLRARGPSRCDRNGSPRRHHAGGRAETDDAGGLSRRAILPYGNVRHRGTV